MDMQPESGPVSGSTPGTSGLRIAVDTGGTFTDIAVAKPDGSLFIWKVSSSPSSPDEAVIEGVVGALQELSENPASVERFVHGTTVATNALITRTGGRVGLVTTKGFRDLLAIGYQSRPHLYSADSRRPEPLAPAELTWEVTERTAADGSEVRELDEDAVRALGAQVAAQSVDVVVVSFLNAYINPKHERRVVELLLEAGAAPAIVSATEVSAEMREFERTSTAVLNGYVQPKVASYLQRLEDRLAELAVPAKLWVMQSNGGLISGKTAREQSVRTLLSGLAGGVIGAARWAGQLGLDKVVSFDIGGTSTDIALIRAGQPDEMTASEIEGYPLRMPTVDVHTIGAGGGSIAWQDSGGGLRVGPQSAGATPGPICYGRGGQDITVTDAHLLLGRLGESLLGGRLTLDAPSARTRLQEFSAELGMDEEKTAEGVLRVITATMARGVRKVSVERGIDIRDCTLMAFGGAGPLHASDLVRELGLRSAVIPPHPGVASAIGMLDAPIRSDFVASVATTDATDTEQIQTALDELTERAEKFIAVESSESGTDTQIERLVDLRYLGQSYELTVPWNSDPAFLREAFDFAHRERYGFDDPDARLEIVAARCVATIPVPATSEAVMDRPDELPVPLSTRPVYFEGSWHDTPIYLREALPAGPRIPGPLVAEQLDSTVVVAPDQTCWIDGSGFLYIAPKDN
ncbi:hydantoinase [Arthrobacter sp. MYb23]|uniref:hydantoinase/oxoprolinase family protein n=1 Tax=unclassified Arthrobacter TaxID=235627 RepID=UPI000CFD8F8F|nr:MULTISPECIES: hydantoinase/oxoprolinase family protein [unclassified Arthrobacter]PRB43049.1 hydantoinase [Arthrobacter sp. MYb51]PRB98001.1 hydantoinase [Arthrobacter sp. MYb23]